MNCISRSKPKTKKEEEEKEDFYESVKALDEYLLMHYGQPDDLIPKARDGPRNALEFPKRCAEKCFEFTQQDEELKGAKCRALDLGCAVGAATFELARFYEEVVGIDFSQSFVDAGDFLKKEGSKPYKIQTEGDLFENRVAEIGEDIDRKRCTFYQGDACNLDLEKLGQFGVVLGANLVCRLPEPLNFLRDLPKLIIPGGYLVLPSPYSWLEQYTPKSKWLGGYTDAETKKPVKTFDTLKAKLADTFDLVHDEEMPFFIRETARKNQLTWSHCTVWKRKADPVSEGP